MKKLLSVLFLLSFTLASVYAQNIQVKGTVVSGTDNEPLPGVNVVVKGTTNGGIAIQVSNRSAIGSYYFNICTNNRFTGCIKNFSVQ